MLIAIILFFRRPLTKLLSYLRPYAIVWLQWLIMLFMVLFIIALEKHHTLYVTITIFIMSVAAVAAMALTHDE